MQAVCTSGTSAFALFSSPEQSKSRGCEPPSLRTLMVLDTCRCMTTQLSAHLATSLLQRGLWYPKEGCFMSCCTACCNQRHILQQQADGVRVHAAREEQQTTECMCRCIYDRCQVGMVRLLLTSHNTHGVTPSTAPSRMYGSDTLCWPG